MRYVLAGGLTLVFMVTTMSLIHLGMPYSRWAGDTDMYALVPLFVTGGLGFSSAMLGWGMCKLENMSRSN